MASFLGVFEGFFCQQHRIGLEEGLFVKGLALKFKQTVAEGVQIQQLLINVLDLGLNGLEFFGVFHGDVVGS